MGWLQALAAEFAITVADGSVWWSIGQALLFGGVCLLFGVWIARFVGLLGAGAPAGETLAVGLASGLLVLAAWWAAVASGGRSSFTPVAVGFAVAVGLAVVQRRRRGASGEAATPEAKAAADPMSPPMRRRNLVVAILGGALFVVAVALLYGSTLVRSERDSVQPLEFQDEAYYSVLGADLATTGTETIYSPSGFDQLDGLPTQTWYHWGELWLASAVIAIFGSPPLLARHFVVLPVVLLACAALTGTIVRCVTGSASRGAYVFGFLACLFLAPVPLIPAGEFSSSALGLIFGIRTYGLAAMAVLLAMYALASLDRRQTNQALIVFAGTTAAFIVPAHIVVAVLALVGIGAMWTVNIARSLHATRRLPVMAAVWRWTFAVIGIEVVATVVWGVLTGHSVGGSGSSPSVSPFNASWRDGVAITTVCSGAFFAIAVAWVMVRNERSIEANLYFGTAALLVTGAFAWGALLSDFVTVHLFFAGIAVFATPVAAVAVWSIWLRLRAAGHVGLAVGLLALAVAQLEFGVGVGVVRLWRFGQGIYPPVPGAVLEAVRSLPADARLAYACQPTEEVSFWDSSLLGINAHTGRRIVPMCFQAEVFGRMTSAPLDADIVNPLFLSAPQRQLYPDSSAHPSSARVSSFLKANGIDYLYADALHPNSLVPDAIPLATSGATQVLRVP